MKRWMYRWLPIICGCHRKPERSFFIKGEQFPVCARCTGELIGILFGIIGIFIKVPPVWILCILLLPMIADGLIQNTTRYESNNIKRVITGTLFGYGLVSLFLLSVKWVFLLGVNMVK